MARFTAACVLAFAVVVAGCSDDPGRLQGATLEPTPVVAALQAPEGAAGTPFRFTADPGGLLAVYFGYTQCPDLCPTTMADLKAAFGKIGSRAERIDVAMVTVDPARDTPAIVADYLAHFFPAGRTHPLRITDPTALKTVEEGFLASSSVTTKPDGTVEVSHTAMTSIVDDQGRIVVQWPFGTSPDTMAHDLRLLLEWTMAAAERS